MLRAEEVSRRFSVHQLPPDMHLLIRRDIHMHMHMIGAATAQGGRGASWTQAAPGTVDGAKCNTWLTEALAAVVLYVQCPSQPEGFALTLSAVLRSCQDAYYLGHCCAVHTDASHYMIQARDQPSCAMPAVPAPFRVHLIGPQALQCSSLRTQPPFYRLDCQTHM